MNIIGMVIHTHPQALPGVCAGLEALPDVVIRSRSDTGRIIVAVEQAGRRSAAEICARIKDITGVLLAGAIFGD